MIRTPLRPLARILSARQKGENPDSIERENLRLRHEAIRDKSRMRSEGRLLFLGIGFLAVFTTIGARMGLLAATEPIEPRAAATGAEITAQRADITDRNGRILATNMQTYALYAQPKDMVDPVRVSKELAAIFPELDATTLERRLTDGRSFLWIRKVMSPEQMQKVHEIGDPGLLFGPREMRLYPNGTLAAHVLGGASFGAEDVQSAEVIGTAGIEKAMDVRLRDPAQAGTPLQLSIDLTLQAAIEEILGAGMNMLNAKGAAAILMDVHTGEILSLASLPAFDPNDRPNPLVKGDAGDSPLFNRAVQGVYELGSTFKIFTVANALQLGLVTPESEIDANAPMRVGRFLIKEFKNHNYGPKLSVFDIIVKSSNVGTANLAMIVGGERQAVFMRALGLFDPTPVELVEASGAKPIVPKKWPDITVMTTSYGHGIAASPMHLAAAYATIANGGIKVTPTLLHGGVLQNGPRVMREQVATDAIRMLRGVVQAGTATLANVPGYQVAGKTGTAEKPNKSGGYDTKKVVNTFASMFPADDPKYVLVVMLDEPVEATSSTPRRTAGWTAVPVAAEVIRRIVPLLGLRPLVESAPVDGLTAVSN
ncbi:MAG: penicillin-binding protein 2 [Rhodobacteraceae bacterium]|nr:penicillin-binding protein 2 [Paracoccaceae bacterium]